MLHIGILVRHIRTHASIEQQTVLGRSWHAVVADLPDDCGITPRNVSDHWRHGHLPIVEATQELMNARAQERGDLVEAAARRAVDYLDFARAIVLTVNRRILAGELQPRVQDGLRAAEVLARQDPQYVLDDASYLAAYRTFHDAARRVMSDDQWDEFTGRLDADPDLALLEEQLEAIQERRGHS